MLLVVLAMFNDIDELVKAWIIDEFMKYLVEANIWNNCISLNSGFNICWVYFHNNHVIVRNITYNHNIEYSRPSFFDELQSVIMDCL